MKTLIATVLFALIACGLSLDDGAEKKEVKVPVVPYAYPASYYYPYAAAHPVGYYPTNYYPSYYKPVGTYSAYSYGQYYHPYQYQYKYVAPAAAVAPAVHYVP